MFYADQDLMTTNIVAIVDAAFANIEDNSKVRLSTGGHFSYHGPNILHAMSSTLRQMASSAPEAGLYQILKTTKTLLYFKGLLGDFVESEVRLAMLSDSQSTVGTMNNPGSSRYKYLSAYIGFVKDLVEKHGLKIVFLPQEFNFPDTMTKQVDVQTFNATDN